MAGWGLQDGAGAGTSDWSAAAEAAGNECVLAAIGIGRAPCWPGSIGPSRKPDTITTRAAVPMTSRQGTVPISRPTPPAGSPGPRQSLCLRCRPGIPTAPHLPRRPSEERRPAPGPAVHGPTGRRHLRHQGRCGPASATGTRGPCSPRRPTPPDNEEEAR